MAPVKDDDDDGVTLDKSVAEALEKLASKPETTGRYFNILRAFNGLRDETTRNLRATVKRYSARKVEQKGQTYFVFVIPSVLVLIRATDTLCAIHRPSDGRTHMHAHRICGSVDEYERMRAEMYLAVKDMDVAALLDGS